MPGSGSRRWVSSFQALAVLALVMALSSCKKETIPEVAEALNNKEAPEWVSHDKNRPNPVAVVFVHGIFGTTKGTWTNKEGVTFFDLIKKNPDIGSKIDVYAFGYTSDMFKEGSLDIYSAADKLDGFLMADKVWEYKTVVFVGHSMGGLVTMQLLLNKRQHLSQVPLVVFYATPQEGSTLASIGEVFLPNPALSQMVPNDPGGFIVGLDNNWAYMFDDPATRKLKPKVVCAHETKSVYKFSVVSKFSATRFCDGARNGIGGADHISITKPGSERDQAVIILANALRDVLGTDRSPRLDLVGFNKVGEDWIYEQGYFNTQNSGAVLQNESAFPIRYYLGKPQPVNSNLLVSPLDTPRVIPPKSKQELGFILMTSGTASNEYRFTVDSGAGDLRNIIVRMPADGKAQKEASERPAKMLAMLSKDLEDPDVKKELSGMTPDEQQQYLVRLAGNHITGIGDVDAPGYRETHALLLADALTASRWSPLAADVMNDLKEKTPSVAETAAFKSLSVTIASRSGNQELRSELEKQGVAIDRVLIERNLDQSTYEIAGAPTWSSSVSKLSDNLQAYPGLEQYGLVLQAERLWDKGEAVDALELYKRLRVMSPTPEVLKKNRELGAVVLNSKSEDPKIQ
ncbi:esterase/lipase family protein [Pseudoxanthomonas mexicana]